MDESTDLELIDVSSKNDNPIIDLQSTENQIHNISSGLLETVVTQKSVDIADVSGQMEQFPQSSRPLESERARKSGKCNLRKSLAWDNAFFTSAGVLEPDELSTMIKGGGKTGKHFLPGIEEDICRSTDSISTIESESLTLESVETGLFEDIRASIQKSSKAYNRTSSSKAASGETGTQAICCVLSPDKLPSTINGVDSCRNFFLPGIEEDTRRSTDSISTLESESLTLGSVEADLFVDIRASIQKSTEASNMKSSSKARTIHSLKKVSDDSNNMLQTKAAFKKQTIGMQAGKLMKQSFGRSQGTQPETRIGSATLSLPKAPKVLGSPATISSAPLKRASLSANQVKFENAKAKGASVPSKGAPLPKKPGLGGSIRTVPPKPPLSSKASSSCSSTATKKDPPKSSSSNGSSCNAPSAKIDVSPLKSNRRRINSKMANTSSSSSTTLKTSTKVALKKKGRAGLSAGLMSSKLSSDTSPTSSISEWSESSSSTSTVNQRSNTSRLSTDSSPGRSLVCDAPLILGHHNQYDHISDIQENKVMPRQNLNTASMQNGALKQPATAKPSGLRMPSPKMGFFDGVKPMVRTPNGSMRSYSCIPTGPKIGAGIINPCEGSSKEEEKLVRLQPARTVTPIRNMKLSSQKPASPVSSQEPSNASAKISSVSAEACLSISPQVQKETDGESFLKDEEIGHRGYDRANSVPDNGQDAENPGELNLEKEGDSYLKDIKIASIKGGNSDSSSQHNAENMKLCEPSEDENSSNKSNEKENLVDQIDGLSICVGAMDLKLGVQKELLGNNIAHIDFARPNSCFPELPCSKEFFVSGLEEKRSLINLSGPTPISLSESLTLSQTETTASMRTPFAVKNSMCDSDRDLSTRVGIGLAEKTLSSECGQKENS